MFFLQATKAPIQVTIGDKVYNVPKMRMGDLTLWGAKIKADKVEELTAGMNSTQQQEYLTFYDIPTPDINAFRKLTYTPEGSAYILKTQLAKATTEAGDKLDTTTIEQLVDDIAHGTRGRLAWEIGDMADTSERNVQAKPATVPANPPNASNASDKSV